MGVRGQGLGGLKNGNRLEGEKEMESGKLGVEEGKV